MIKLKKLLESHHTVVVGYISMDGIIHSEETTNTHFGLNFHRGKCWRFNPYNDILYWHGDWSEHNEVDEINVATHLLKKYEYKVKKNITLEETEYTDYVSHFNNAHGLHENVSQNDITNRIKIISSFHLCQPFQLFQLLQEHQLYRQRQEHQFYHQQQQS